MSKKMGRPKTDVDWEQIIKMLQLGMTLKEIVIMTEISKSTLQRACKEEFDETFDTFIKRHQGNVKMSLRRDLIKQSKNGNVTASIYLDRKLNKYLEPYQEAKLKLDKQKFEFEKSVKTEFNQKVDMIKDDLIEALIKGVDIE